MRIRVFPKIYQVELIVLPDELRWSDKAQENRTKDRVTPFPYPLLKKYLTHWYPDTFTFNDTEEWAETDVEEDSEWYRWHIQGCLDHVKFIDGKMRNGFQLTWKKETSSLNS
jgi:hypothetical protein